MPTLCIQMMLDITIYTGQMALKLKSLNFFQKNLNTGSMLQIFDLNKLLVAKFKVSHHLFHEVVLEISYFWTQNLFNLTTTKY
jgi:hypothetical protein